MEPQGQGSERAVEPQRKGSDFNLKRVVLHRLAVGETVILLPPPLPFSRRFNRDGEGAPAK